MHGAEGKARSQVPSKLRQKSRRARESRIAKLTSSDEQQKRKSASPSPSSFRSASALFSGAFYLSRGLRKAFGTHCHRTRYQQH